MIRRWCCVVSLAVGLLGVTAAYAQDAATTVTRLVVAFPPGATNDLVARLLAQKLTPLLGSNVIAENRPGANGNIAAEFVARAKPDGQTLFFNSNGLVVSHAMKESATVDAVKDFAPVSRVGWSPYVLVVHPSLPVKTPAEFIALARAHPGKLSYGSAASLSYLSQLLFLQANKLTALHVPYKGGGPVIVDLVGGRLQFTKIGRAHV